MLTTISKPSVSAGHSDPSTRKHYIYAHDPGVIHNAFLRYNVTDGVYDWCDQAQFTSIDDARNYMNRTLFPMMDATNGVIDAILVEHQTICSNMNVRDNSVVTYVMFKEKYPVADVRMLHPTIYKRALKATTGMYASNKSVATKAVSTNESLVGLLDPYPKNQWQHFGDCYLMILYYLLKK